MNKIQEQQLISAIDKTLGEQEKNKTLSDWSIAFLDSVLDQYIKVNSLSEKQISTATKILLEVNYSSDLYNDILMSLEVSDFNHKETQFLQSIIKQYNEKKFISEKQAYICKMILYEQDRERFKKYSYENNPGTETKSNSDVLF
jgi:hypothetical protein